MNTIFTAIAQLRWSNYKVVGEGHIAVVNHCKGIVSLFELPIFAQDAVSKSCGESCIQKHNIVVLHEPRPEPYPVHKPARFPRIRDKHEAVSA